jgi:hypothetical protein
MAVLVSGVVAWGSGCGAKGPELSAVEGTVTLDGQPLAHAHVEFHPVQEERTSYDGQTDRTGHYELHASAKRKGAEPGDYLVRITLPKQAAEPGVTPQLKLPVRFNTQTELKATVKAGKNKCDFPLTSN